MIRIEESAESVEIRLLDSTEARSARIHVAGSGADIWTGPVRDGAVLVPASVLAAEDHVLTTRGETGEEIADYVFRVIR